MTSEISSNTSRYSAYYALLSQRRPNESLVETSIRIHRLKKKFPDAVLEEAANLKRPFDNLEKAAGLQQPFDLSDLIGRKDLRDKIIFTIDPDTAQDFDDALSIEGTQNKDLSLGVHIADVTRYVKTDSLLDKEACNRGTSVYFPEQCLPMLPEVLSNDICSLMPDKDRLTHTVEMIFDWEGNLKSYEIYLSVIRSKKRFTYSESKQILKRQDDSAFRPQLNIMMMLAQALKQKRLERGCLDLNVHSHEESTDIDLEEVDSEEECNTHMLVEEFMIKANEVVATHLHAKNLPFLYRVHPSPPAGAYDNFIQDAQRHGWDISSLTSKKELNELFASKKGGRNLSELYLRTMKKAYYSSGQEFHFGLQTNLYCHFTSPIRRYPDIIVHKVLKGESVSLEWLRMMSIQQSELEITAKRAEASTIGPQRNPIVEAPATITPHPKLTLLGTKKAIGGIEAETETVAYDISSDIEAQTVSTTIRVEYQFYSLYKITQKGTPISSPPFHIEKPIEPFEQPLDSSNRV